MFLQIFGILILASFSEIDGLSIPTITLPNITLPSIIPDVLNVPNIIVSNVVGLQPEVTMTLPQLLDYYGYPLETHTVTTEDGYILTSHHISHGKNNAADPTKFPALLVHGSDGLSDIWVANTINKNLALILADQGYDVWMINLRGNVYSRQHETLKPNQAEFWAFCWDQMAYYDVAAFIDDVIAKTGKNQVVLVGQSLGGSLPLALLADRPEYNSKVKAVYSLSPLGNLAGIDERLVLAAELLPPVFEALTNAGIYELGTPPWIPKAIIGLLVKNFDPVYKIMLSNTLGTVSGDWWNSTQNPTFATHSDGGTAINVLKHFAQQANNPGFRHYDFGPTKNMELYGVDTAPDYDLSKVTVPVRLFYTTNDFAASKENMDFLHDNLGNAISLNIAGNNWNHNAYFMASDADLFFGQLTASITTDTTGSQG